MTPRDPEMLASRWRLDDMLAGNRKVEVHAATDTELGTDVVAVLWSDDPGPSGREVDDGDFALVDWGVHDSVWFATYARLDGAPLAPAATVGFARSFVPDENVAAPVPAPPAAEPTVEVPMVPAASRRRGLLAAGVAGLLLLLAAGALLGQATNGDGGSNRVEPRAAEATQEPLQAALQEHLHEVPVDDGDDHHHHHDGGAGAPPGEMSVAPGTLAPTNPS